MPVLSFAQVAAGHVGGLVEAEEAEDGGGHVFERAVVAEFEAEGVFVNQMKGDGVGGVGGVGLAGVWVNHEFAVAVVGGDEAAAAGCAQGLGYPAEAGVNVLDGLDGLLEELGEGYGEVEGLVVEGEADEVNLRPVRGGELLEAGDGQRARDLAGAVGAEVVEDYRVAVFDCGDRGAVGARDDDGFDEL